MGFLDELSKVLAPLNKQARSAIDSGYQAYKDWGKRNGPWIDEKTGGVLSKGVDVANALTRPPGPDWFVPTGLVKPDYPILYSLRPENVDAHVNAWWRTLTGQNLPGAQKSEK